MSRLLCALGLHAVWRERAAVRPPPTYLRRCCVCCGAAWAGGVRLVPGAHPWYLWP